MRDRFTHSLGNRIALEDLDGGVQQLADSESTRKVWLAPELYRLEEAETPWLEMVTVVRCKIRWYISNRTVERLRMKG